MDDGKSKNYNSIIASLVCELLYEGGNVEISKDFCYQHVTQNLKINVEPDLFSSILEKNGSFQLKSDPEIVLIKLKPEKYAEINKKVDEYSLEYYISAFVAKNEFQPHIKVAIENMLYESIYENINSFSISNIKSILPDVIKTKYQVDEIEAFNSFLDQNDRIKDAALFDVFLKAVEFAILTSGKGVKQFTKDIFTGKEYCLDSNIIFRMLGVNGVERQESIKKLIQSCIHQGIKFSYAVETYKEVKRKIDASIVDIQKGAETRSLDILQELINEDGIQVNNSFITHYAQCKIDGLIKSPEQYQYKLLADFRALEREFNLTSVAKQFNANKISFLQDFLFEKKKEANGYSRYTKTAAQVDAHNILLVRNIRGANNYNYSDIKSFYLTTDKMLNSILAISNQENIAETILPSQLYILHNALADNDEENKDYQAFNKFLKRRTTQFKYEGKDILNFIDEIRNITADTYTIKDVIKSYSDNRYEHSLNNLDSEPEYKSFKEYAETYLDQLLGSAKLGDEKYQKTLNIALGELPQKLNEAKRLVRNLDILFSISILPIAAVILKKITENIFLVIGGTLLIEAGKYMISSKTKLLSNICRAYFLKKVRLSAFYKATNGEETRYMKAALDLIKDDINVYK